MEDLRAIFVRTRSKNPSFEGADGGSVETSLRRVLSILIGEVRLKFRDSSSLETASLIEDLRAILLLGFFFVVLSPELDTEALTETCNRTR